MSEAPPIKSALSEQELNETVVILIEGINLFGDAIYSYVELTLRNFREFVKKRALGENIKPSDFGTVLAAGRGEPPAELREEMALTHRLMDVPVLKPPAPAAAKAKPVYTPPKFFDDDSAS